MLTQDSLFDLNGVGYCAQFNFRRTARAVTRLFDLAFQESGIRSTQFSILVGVAKSQPTSISALADTLLIDPTTLTRSLRLLQKEGLLEVSQRSAKRQRFITLSPAGEQKLARSLPAWRAAQERWDQAVGREQWIELRQKLEALAHLAVSLGTPPKNSQPGPTTP